MQTPGRAGVSVAGPASVQSDGLPGQQRSDPGLFPVTLRCHHYNLCLANVLVPSTGDANTEVYGLSPCPYHSVRGHIAKSAGRNASPCNLHFSVVGICLFAKELRSTDAQYDK